MATIIRQERKGGINFRIQVAVKDTGSGKRITKTATYDPPKGLTEREIQRDVQKFAILFEDECRKNGVINQTNGNITVKEYSVIWLKTLRQTASPAYYSSSLRLMKEVVAALGGYRLKELTPVIIQRFVDGLRKKEYVINTATPAKLAKVITKQKLSWNRVGLLSGVSSTTVKAAVNGRVILPETAEKIATALGVKATELFDIERKVKPYAAESIAKVYRTLKAMLSFAKRQMLIPENYAKADFVKGIKPDKRPIRCMNLAEATELLGHVKKEPDIRKRTVINILLLMGIRRGECAGLEWQDIDLEKGTMSIARSSSQITGFGVVTGKPKSEHSKRTIDMPPSLINILKEYKEWWQKTTDALGDRYGGSNRLFLQSNGLPISPSTILYWLNVLTEKYGLPKVSVHSLRHTNISVQLTSQLIPDKEVSARAGHGSTKVTKDIYWELFRQDGKNAAMAIDGLFGNKE